MNHLLALYTQAYHRSLLPISRTLEEYIKDILDGLEHVDRISARAKGPKSFCEKATKTSDGCPKYKEPMREIQDQIGARVIVYYKPDVEIVQERILKFFRHIELKDRTPASDIEFDYFGRHFILLLPQDISGLAEVRSDVPRFFELQIKTLFQHAWSEAEHDLAYKIHSKPLTADQRRLLAFSSAQAWGADRVFEQLYTELNE